MNLKLKHIKKPTHTPIKVAPEDYSLSPTALYKKYMNELTTDAFKAGNISKVSAPTPVTDAIPTTPQKEISKADQKLRVVKILKRSDDPEGYDEIRKKDLICE